MKLKDQITVHEKYCGATNRRTALVFFVSTAVIAFAGWRSLDKPLQAWDTVSLLFVGYSILVVAGIALQLRCTRERVILGIGIFQFSKIIVMSLFPEWFEATHLFIRQVTFYLWLVAFLIALSLLISALAHQVAADTH